jgi:hypothetical protein
MAGRSAKSLIEFPQLDTFILKRTVRARGSKQSAMVMKPESHVSSDCRLNLHGESCRAWGWE